MLYYGMLSYLMLSLGSAQYEKGRKLLYILCIEIYRNIVCNGQVARKRPYHFFMQENQKHSNENILLLQYRKFCKLYLNSPIS